MVRLKRVCTFAAIGFATSAAVLWPLFITYRVHEDRSPREWLLASPVVRIGDHITQGVVSGFLLAVLLDPCSRFDHTVEIHIWTRRYILAITLQSLTLILGKPLLLLCGQSSSSRSFFFLLNGTMGFACYVACQSILLHITVLRLWVVASPQKAMWAARLLKLMLVFLAPTMVFVFFSYGESLPHPVFLLVSRMFAISFCISLFFGYALFQGISLQEFVRVARDAVTEADHQEADAEVKKTAARARTAVVFLAMSAATTLLYIVVLFIIFSIPKRHSHLWLWFCYQFSHVLDVTFDAGLVIVCAGLSGPTSDRDADLKIIGRLARTRRKRHMQEKLVEAARATTGPAAMIAALFQGVEPNILMDKAVQRFRCIPWDELREHPEVLCQGTQNEFQNAPVDVYELSKPCCVGECDAFLSHSWHDDAQQKWEALAEWCTEFQRTNKRTPSLWLDKVCIDQKNIAEDLQCLPIFLASCNTLLVITGLTYTSRLWCCVELFVYVNMRMQDETRHLPVIITLGGSENERAQVNNSWAKFDVAACRCSNEEDKQRLIRLVDKYPGRASGFNTYVRSLGALLLQFPIQRQDSSTDSSRIESKWDLFDTTLSGLSEPIDSVVIQPSPSFVGSRTAEVRLFSL